MQRPLEVDSPCVAIQPADRCFYCFNAVEFHPNLLADVWAFDELDFATVWGRVEHPNTETVNAGASDAHLSREGYALVRGFPERS